MRQRTETEGKWFYEKQDGKCGAYRIFQTAGENLLAVCDLPDGHDGEHAGDAYEIGRVTWNDQAADVDNRIYWRRLNPKLPLENGV